MPTNFRGNRPGPINLQRVRALRHEATEEERILWSRLKNRQVASAKFRRQQEFGPYILDYFCPEHGLLVEVDGGQHFSDEGERADLERVRYLNLHGIRVLRFSNLEVRQALAGVMDVISEALADPASLGKPSP